MSKLNRQSEVQSADGSAGFIATEVDAPDGSGTYVMLGLACHYGRLGIVTPYRSIEAFAAALTKNAKTNAAKTLLQGVPGQEGMV